MSWEDATLFKSCLKVKNTVEGYKSVISPIEENEFIEIIQL